MGKFARNQILNFFRELQHVGLFARQADYQRIVWVPNIH
jgi:hypothetical protein